MKKTIRVTPGGITNYESEIRWISWISAVFQFSLLQASPVVFEISLHQWCCPRSIIIVPDVCPSESKCASAVIFFFFRECAFPPRFSPLRPPKARSQTFAIPALAQAPTESLLATTELSGVLESPDRDILVIPLGSSVESFSPSPRKVSSSVRRVLFEDK